MPHSTYLPERMGSATLDPQGSFEAGSIQSFTLTYTAGFYGIDDTGSIKIAFRTVSDMARPQIREPGSPNYVSVEASNGAVLDVRYDDKQNIRPWDKTLYIKVVRGFLKEGDRIVVRFGDRRQGCPGMRIQTFCENAFEFKTFIDAFATYNYVELPQSPFITIVPGQPVNWKAVLPTVRRVDQRFRLGIKGEDAWGNPSDLCDLEVRLRCTHPIAGLPESIRLAPGQFATSIDGLTVNQPGLLRVQLLARDGRVLATSNPLKIVADAPLLPFWADLHGQSGETVGSNTARDYFIFARDRAFLDACCHQGNDFQITNAFWMQLNDLTREFNRDGGFIAFPGYEWSGNTGLGGDRNVLYLNEGGPLHRSSHALVEDLTDVHTDADTAHQLFKRLEGNDCLVFPHVGGRYSDIKYAHDGRFERAVEVHSAWGTFEWMIEDALDHGYRVGITANSDDHKGRLGASYPGASMFGAYGGLTCILAKELTRKAIFEALRSRHHYGTTGNRMILHTRVSFDSPAELFEDDPNLGPTQSKLVNSAMMGDILRFDGGGAILHVEAVGCAPIERLEIRNGRETLEVFRPFSQTDLGRRIRVIWEGSEYRGRGRQTIWDGSARLEGNRFERVQPINFYNLDKQLERVGVNSLKWSSLTTGGISGFDAWLADSASGVLVIDTLLVKATIPMAEIGLDDRVWDAGGLGRRLRVFRMPETNPHDSVTLERRLRLRSARDNAIYVCVTTEDGHRAWSSPIYIFK